MTHAEIHHARMALIEESAQSRPHTSDFARSLRRRYEALQWQCAAIGHLFGRTHGGDAWCVICTVSMLKGIDIDFREPERGPG